MNKPMHPAFAIYFVRGLPLEAVPKSQALQTIAAYPPVAREIDEICDVPLDPKDPYAPHPLTVRDMCHAMLAMLVRSGARPTLGALVSTVRRSLRWKVQNAFYPDRVVVRSLPSEARLHLDHKRKTDEMGTEPTDMAWAKAISKSVAEIRASRTAYRLARLKPFNGDWIVRGPEGLAAAVRCGRNDITDRHDDDPEQVPDVERLCDLHDRYGE